MPSLYEDRAAETETETVLVYLEKNVCKFSAARDEDLIKAARLESEDEEEVETRAPPPSRVKLMRTRRVWVSV